MNIFFPSCFAFFLLSSFDPACSCPTVFESQSNGTSFNPQDEDSRIRLTRQIHDAQSPLPIEGMGLTELEFGYKNKDGPLKWPSKFRWCGKNKQSPVDIILERANIIYEENIFFENYDVPPQQMSLVNNGKTINLGGTWDKEDRPYITSSLLEEEYIFEALHFHWGKNEYEGSEHLIDGERYPSEMHLVHFKKSYRSFARSVNYIDGLAVVSYVFQVHPENNPDLQSIIEATDKIHNAKARTTLTPFPLNYLAPTFSRSFASYKGSLTTPPCNEIVTWFVSLKPLRIGVDQLNKLRKLKDDDGDLLVRNFRPVQPLNDREIIHVPRD